MRGNDREQGSMFSCVSLEERIPEDHPLRPMRAMVNEALKTLSRPFSGLYADGGRPSIPPERLLRALRRLPADLSERDPARGRSQRRLGGP